MDQDQLEALNREMGLGLNQEEMRRIKDYYSEKGRDATDVELHCIAQAWSEHCSYKSSRRLIRKYLKPLGSRAYRIGDAGVMSFDEEHVYSLKMESHNHPSAIEPYGGAGTGIGGIVRDILCMGTRPVALADPLFFGDLRMDEHLLPAGVKHPRYLFSGVVAGIRDYGNRIGVPTITGGVWFDRRYTGNCLVNAGCVGFGRKEDVLPNRFLNPGDVVILAGGLTGRDGLHGVNFASKVLSEHSEESDRGAVQLGDPITKEPLMNAIAELVRGKLIVSMKDLGGGGLSACAGEMAEAGELGASIALDAVPLREQGMQPWEIWVSESQERMLISARRGDEGRILETFDFWDVSASVIGTVSAERRIVCSYQGEIVLDLETSFPYGELEYARKIKAPERRRAERIKVPDVSAEDALHALLQDTNICSRDWVVHMYDHDVGGRTVIKPLQGIPPFLSHGDAAVLRPDASVWKGIAVSVAASPWIACVDPYGGALNAVDELCRNIVAVGATPDALTNCLNMGNPERPEVMWQFKETLRGIADACGALGIAVPSGNVSFYNESEAGQIPPTAALLGTGLVEDVRRCVTSDLKEEGDALYLVGDRRLTLAHSSFARVFGASGGSAVRPDLHRSRDLFVQMHRSIAGGMVRSCHDLSDGGLSVALSEMCFGGGMGATIDVSAMGRRSVLAALFSEGPTHWIVEVAAGMEEEFERTLSGYAIQIGHTGGGELCVFRGQNIVLSNDVGELKEMWRNRLWRLM